MADRSNSTSGSIADSNGNKLAAPKDKNCPFCGQAFTSSSLGRHLDLYIKEKNPKPPDGIHDVDKIRDIRGNITRRQARTSSGKLLRDCSTASTPVPSAAKPVSLSQHGSPMVLPDSAMSIATRRSGLRINEPDWRATGVINGLVPRPAETPTMRQREVSRQDHKLHMKAEIRRRQQKADENELGLAAQDALREVLASVREISAKSQRAALFDFNPCTLSFPGLCLSILPAPSSIFSSTPFATNDSWSLAPPSQKQFEALKRRITEKFRWKRDVPTSRPPSPSDHTSDLSNYECERILNHLQDAYAHWKSLPEKQKHDTWQMEVLRAYARSEEKKREADTALAKAQSKIAALEAELARRDWLDSGRRNDAFGNPLPIVPLEAARQLTSKAYDGEWDYDRLIKKWRDRRKPQDGLLAQRALSGSSTMSTTDSMSASQSCLNRSIQTVASSILPPSSLTGEPEALASSKAASFPGVAPQPSMEMDLDDDDEEDSHADGEGEDEDADADGENDAEEAPDWSHISPAQTTNTIQQNTIQQQQPIHQQPLAQVPSHNGIHNPNRNGLRNQQRQHPPTLMSQHSQALKVSQALLDRAIMSPKMEQVSAAMSLGMAMEIENAGPEGFWAAS